MSRAIALFLALSVERCLVALGAGRVVSFRQCLAVCLRTGGASRRERATAVLLPARTRTHPGSRTSYKYYGYDQ
eukprot:scaffold2387_cov40-Prasinocladus_malaysianus.AAC.1